MPREHVYSDFHKTLEIDERGDVEILYDEDVIIQSIKTIMATVRGERVRSPFGGSLVSLLFEPMGADTAETIKFDLKNIVEQYEPRVEINRIDVVADFDRNSYSVSMLLTIREINRRVRFQTRLRSLAA